MVTLIASQREYGAMLVAERKTHVYERTDGGDGAGKEDTSQEDKANAPKEDTPQKSWNMFVPVVLLVFFIFYLLIKTGEDPSVDQSLMDKIEASDSYQALLWGTMATAICTMLFYFSQIVQDGELVGLSSLIPSVRKMFTSSEDDESKTRFLMSLNDNVEGFLHGMARIFPAIIVLNLAWAVGAMMTTVGADRLFARWIVGGLSPEALPTLSFVISFFMALATGTSWGTMSILFPLVLVPTYEAPGSNEIIFYATTAGILSGSVAGDHTSPISDTTVLSALACDCNVLSHVATQAEYSLLITIVSILLGTIPIGYSSWPNIIGILIGAGLVIAFVFFVCVPVICENGRYDLFTEAILKYKKMRGFDSELFQLKEDTAKYYRGDKVTSDSEKPSSIEQNSEDIEEVAEEA